jgi:hypothetical protein
MHRITFECFRIIVEVDPSSDKVRREFVTTGVSAPVAEPKPAQFEEAPRAD